MFLQAMLLFCSRGNSGSGSRQGSANDDVGLSNILILSKISPTTVWWIAFVVFAFIDIHYFYPLTCHQAPISRYISFALLAPPTGQKNEERSLTNR